MRVLFALAATLLLGSCALAATFQTVGRQSFVVTDSARADPVAPAHRRAWMVDLYYPAESAGAPGPYANDDAILATMIAQGYYNVPEADLRSWAQTPAPATDNARRTRGRALPLILLSPGSGVVRFNYSRLAAALVARGYIVAVVDHPYVGLSRLPDGRVLDASEDPAQQSEDPSDLTPRVLEWSRDLSVVLDRLAGPSFQALRIDLDHVIAVGHSTGGAIALDACASEPRIDACMDFEGGLFGSRAETDGVAKPVLVTASRARGRPRVQSNAAEEMMAALAQRGAPVWYVRVTGGSHMSFSDAPTMMPETLTHFGGEVMTPERSDAVYGGMVDAFARTYVLGSGDAAKFAAFLAGLPEAETLRPAAPDSP